ncbi:MAG TPA: hypothetical protein VFQ80_14880 [Thermomicrobiales bacterium]|nr:hypothetical protein [Thermomicrobiales bacterium]
MLEFERLVDDDDIDGRQLFAHGFDRADRRCAEDDRNLPQAGIEPGHRQKFPAFDLTLEEDVDDDDVGSQVFDPRPIEHVNRGRDAIAFRFQQRLEQIEQLLRIVHHQNVRAVRVHVAIPPSAWLRHAPYAARLLGASVFVA